MTSLEETGNHTWNAEVEGSETYVVEVTLENNNEIADHFCDCPYDEATCKHAAAVFFALRDKISKKKNKPKETRKKDVFENLLQTVSLTECQDFIRAYALNNKNFKTEFELFFADKDSRIDVEKKYTELVTKLIKKHSHGGFIDYRASSALSREINKLLATGSSYIAKHNFTDSFALAKAVIKPMIQALTDADDSNGSISNSIDQAISLLENIANAATAAVNIKEQLFEFLQAELNDSIYFEYGDFGYDLFAVFQALAIQFHNATAFLHFVDVQLAKPADKYENHSKEYFQKSKIDFLQLTGKAAEAEALIQQSMDIVEVRLEQINKALAKKDYAIAKQLTAEGIKIAEKKRHPGTVTGWQELLLHIAVLEKDVATIRHYTKHFAFDRGFSADYYRKWKATFSPAEWTNVIEQHIAETIKKINNQKSNRMWSAGYASELYNVAPIYIEEKYWDRLLALIQQEKDLDTVLQFHGFLVKDYPKELLAVYLPLLEAYGLKADNRSQYAYLVKKIKLIIKDIPAGKEKIVAIAQILKDLFSVKPRRPAMIEELNKILQ